MKTEFFPHGECSYTVEDNIITIDATGPWNLEFFKQMHLELSELVSHQVDPTNFAVLLIFRGDSIAVKDGLAYHLSRVKNSNTKALALFTGYSNSPQLTNNIFKNVYDEAGLYHQNFDSIASAKAWLTDKLD